MRWKRKWFVKSFFAVSKFANEPFIRIFCKKRYSTYFLKKPPVVVVFAESSFPEGFITCVMSTFLGSKTRKTPSDGIFLQIYFFERFFHICNCNLLRFENQKSVKTVFFHKNTFSKVFRNFLLQPFNVQKLTLRTFF